MHTLVSEVSEVVWLVEVLQCRILLILVFRLFELDTGH